MFKGEGISFKQKIDLIEGDNTIKVVAVDQVGWETSEKFIIASDTKVPMVTFKVEKGNQYFQGRAVSDINGKTEPGAMVYLYVYRQIGYEYTPDFKRAWKKTVADKNGSFTFDGVNFESEPLSLEVLAPQEVPNDLQKYVLYPLEQLEYQQSSTYHIFIIAEDQSGKTGFSTALISINTCYSSNLDFDIHSLVQFQAPLRLDPQLLDEGRETITAVFNLSYQGSGYAGKALEQEAFVIQNVEFEPACTPGMREDSSFKLGCSILPHAPRGRISNGDKTAWYITYNLHSTEKMSEKKTSYWEEFKKRQLVFPLKIKVHYAERDDAGNLGPVKTQVACYDLSYFVDIPIESSDLVPDFLADEGVRGINATINSINKVMPYLETAMKVAGITCIGSFTVKMMVKYVRIVTSKIEAFSSKVKKLVDKDEKDCPYNQNNLLLKSTIEEWEKYASEHGGWPSESNPGSPGFYPGWNSDEYKAKETLDARCPATASMWATEKYLDQAYRWTCDRFFCRSVPAKWTEDKEKQQVDSVILEQQQCASSSRGVPLREIENCQEMIEGVQKSSIIEIIDRKVYSQAKTAGNFPCFLNTLNNQLYYINPQKLQANQIFFTLQWIAPRAVSFKEAEALTSTEKELLVYRPYNSKDFIVGVDQTCENVCNNERNPGYKADKDNGISNYYKSQSQPGRYGCYRESIDPVTGKITWLDKNNQPMKEGRYAAGYTADCFVETDGSGTPIIPQPGNTGLLQCVCASDQGVKPDQPVSARYAAPGEPWDYHQATVYNEHKAGGTYYPKWRYYAGRDFSSAFGANYITDYLREEGKATTHEINPHTQIIGTFQTVCLPGIRARLVALRSILQQTQNCILDAKKNGLQDAGVCKTLFSQQICGLIYKGIAYLASGCNPYNFQDQTKGGGTLEGVGEVFTALAGSVEDTMKSSIDEVTSDYTNANLQAFFAGGAKGYAQSICMAAFGFDWPMGMDFIMDSAYAFPTATNVQVIPAERELATYDPTKGTAVYNYRVGAAIVPGFKIRTAKVYLKCVGKEDLLYPGTSDCGQQGCDCLNANEPSSALEGEKTWPLTTGRLLN
ncbi:hypothetical protein HZC32_00885, partial [Candidatus Woesearchaeota archaeon]|nr:hypothetical protein [Candidatus Woesearchaeota archaeon]